MAWGGVEDVEHNAHFNLNLSGWLPHHLVAVDRIVGAETNDFHLLPAEVVTHHSRGNDCDHYNAEVTLVLMYSPRALSAEIVAHGAKYLLANYEGDFLAGDIATLDITFQVLEIYH